MPARSTLSVREERLRAVRLDRLRQPVERVNIGGVRSSRPFFSTRAQIFRPSASMIDFRRACTSSTLQ